MKYGEICGHILTCVEMFRIVKSVTCQHFNTFLSLCKTVGFGIKKLPEFPIQVLCICADWKCPNCSVMVFASKNECFKCHTKKDGTKAQCQIGTFIMMMMMRRRRRKGIRMRTLVSLADGLR